MTRAAGADGRRDVEVWAIPLRQPHRVMDALRADLDAEEGRRAAGDPRYGVAHAATRRILADRAGPAARDLRRTAGPHGKPRLTGPGADLDWNLSASGDWALLALLPAGPPAGVGVDVQHLVSADAALRLARRYFPAAEARSVAQARSPAEAYTRLWTYKEAYVKAFGGRLTEGLGVPVPPGPAGIMDGPLGRCRAGAVPGPAPGLLAAVAVTGDLPPRPLPRMWTCAPAGAR
ncbi:4'-phosphopantetheinyl transferase family protein [Actinacidiphila sp. ITFR-21]|uniref:4'-phosphopantetheinyl transferase family protein n=1 Tax=Actinacidiphila sp. ITFR-21 TaxID=3075199 RepID=UPI00288907CE|nr:4'-phosphopantetheinyl transferase superfamily protein [Streptomyces sp. ITFR-21]WNI19426.1 4'-phosphopantetheinyl transferase superfamily protein [Streptomyces sp. ITFR-21]